MYVGVTYCGHKLYSGRMNWIVGGHLNRELKVAAYAAGSIQWCCKMRLYKPSYGVSASPASIAFHCNKSSSDSGANSTISGCDLASLSISRSSFNSRLDTASMAMLYLSRGKNGKMKQGKKELQLAPPHTCLIYVCP